jgi:hypothetical protein
MFDEVNESTALYFHAAIIGFELSLTPCTLEKHA